MGYTKSGGTRTDVRRVWQEQESREVRDSTREENVGFEPQRDQNLGQNVNISPLPNGINWDFTGIFTPAASGSLLARRLNLGYFPGGNSALGHGFHAPSEVENIPWARKILFDCALHRAAGRHVVGREKSCEAPVLGAQRESFQKGMQHGSTGTSKRVCHNPFR